MSVELLDTPRFHGFRVRRQIDNKTYQEYFSLKQDGCRLRGPARAVVRQRAEARDAELASTQRLAKLRSAADVRLDERGRVRGILFRRKVEKSGSVTPTFQVGLASVLEGRLVNTTVSIKQHGFDEAWRRAVAFYARHRGVAPGSKTHRRLLGAKPSEALAPRLYGPAPAAKGPRRAP